MLTDANYGYIRMDLISPKSMSGSNFSFALFNGGSQTQSFNNDTEVNFSTAFFSNISAGKDEATDVYPSNIEALLLTRFVVQRILVPLVVCIGAGGNMVSIAVLTHKSMKTSTNYYLTALAVFDTLYLITSLILSLKHYEDLSDKYTYLYAYVIARVLSDMWANVSVCLTVTFTVERWIAVCHPMKSHVICTPQRAKCIALTVSIVVIGCTSPEFKEWEVYEDSAGNETIYGVRTTTFGQGVGYAVYFNWFVIVMFTFLPLIALCTFNLILIRTVCMASRLRRQMTYVAVKRSTERYAGEQIRITCMLISVALVFILCQLPTASMIIYSTYLEIKEIELTSEEVNSLRIAGNVTNLLLSVNAAMNFVLYSALSTKFRRVFMRRFCWWHSGHKMSHSFTDYSFVSGVSFVKRSSTSRRPHTSGITKEGSTVFKTCGKDVGIENVQRKWLHTCKPEMGKYSNSICLNDTHRRSPSTTGVNVENRDTFL